MLTARELFKDLLHPPSPSLRPLSRLAEVIDRVEVLAVQSPEERLCLRQGCKRLKKILRDADVRDRARYFRKSFKWLPVCNA